jgi:hypothetical protein
MRLPTLVLASVLALGGLAGCSSDDGTLVAGDPATAGSTAKEDPSTKEGPLTQAQLDEALLTVENLSPEFEVDEGDDDDDDEAGPDWGCLDFDSVGGDDGDLSGGLPEGERDFAASDEPGIPGIFQVVTALPDEGAARAGLDQFDTIASDCESVDTTEDDGTRWQFDVRSDHETWADDVDQQINLNAAGTVELSGLELPLQIHLTLVRIDNAVIMLGFFDMADDVGTTPRDLVGAAAARLASVLAGESVPEAEPLLEDYPIGKAFNELLSPTQGA